MAYLTNIPLSTDLQNVTQGQILGNFTQLNTSFGIDHYPFTTNGSLTGFHNQVTTPAIIGSAVPTVTSNAILFALNPLEAVGLLQYSVSTNSSVPTPLTKMQSTASGITLAISANTTVLNFTGLNTVIAMLYMCSGKTTMYSNVALVTYYAGVLVVNNIASAVNSQVSASASGQNLIITNGTIGTVSLFWTLEFQRIL